MTLPPLDSDERAALRDALEREIDRLRASLTNVHEWAALYLSTQFQIRTLVKVWEAIRP